MISSQFNFEVGNYAKGSQLCQFWKQVLPIFVPTGLGITTMGLGPSIISQVFHGLALVFRASKYKLDLKTFKVLAVLLDSEKLIRIEKPSEHQRLS